MKNLKRLALAALSAALLLCAAGCASVPMTLIHQSLLGHWVDVNSTTTMEISSTIVTIDFQTFKESYKYSVRTSLDGETTLYIMGNAPIDQLSLTDGGELSGYEIILDGDGIKYLFVREENLDRYLAIKDLSDPDAKKTIESNEIESFSLSFHNYGVSYGLKPGWPAGACFWEIEDLSGVYEMDFRIMGSSYIAMDFSGEVTEEYMKGLAQVLNDCGAVAQNGYHQKNEVDYPGYELYVRYRSGETLLVRAEGDAARDCVFDLNALLDYAATQDLRAETE